MSEPQQGGEVAAKCRNTEPEGRQKNLEFEVLDHRHPEKGSRFKERSAIGYESLSGVRRDSCGGRDPPSMGGCILSAGTARQRRRDTGDIQGGRFRKK